MDRIALLTALAECSLPLRDLATGIVEAEWDGEGDAVPLLGRHLAAVLKRHLAGEFTAADVELWAAMVESREDLILDPENEEAMEYALYELANPDMTQPLTAERAGEFVRFFG